MTEPRTAEADIERFRRHNRWLGRAATGVIAIIAAIMGLTLAIISHGRLSHPDVVARLALTWSPSVFYLGALWTLRGLFAGLAKAGLSFQPSLTRALARTGWALMAGSLLTMVTTPMILALSHPIPSGWFATFNVPALTLFMLGLALAIIARMLERAVALQAEAAQMKGDLEGFI